jgi:hypothetical protein
MVGGVAPGQSRSVSVDPALYSRAVSWLRASRKVVDPDGVKWDIYVTRIRVGDAGQVFDPTGPSFSPRWDILMFAMTIASELMRVVVRVLMLLPFALVRSRFGITRRIEAIAEWPQPVKRVWQVEGPPGKLLLDEIARGLERGTVPEPAGARYLGEEPYG